MATEGLSQMASSMGLGAALSVAIFIAFFFLLKWVLGVSSEQLECMHRERQSWSEIQKGFIEQMSHVQDQINTNIVTSSAFYAAVQEAHRFQREEHKEMIASLSRINGYKD